MKRIILLLAALLSAASAVRAGELDDLRRAFVRAAVAGYAPDADATRRLIECSDCGRANDVLLLQLYMSVQLPDAEVERLLALLGPDGRWTDIDYGDRTRGRWQPTLHLTRLYALAKLWADPQSRRWADPQLGRVLHEGIACWLRLDPHCPNWWHNEIGVPKKLAAILLMLGSEATPDEIAGGLRILERSPFGRTGQNRVWLAGNNLMKGLLTDDPRLVRQARDTIAEEIYQTTDEGIQPDWSFHQHGPQIQFGNYGLAYAEGISFWFRVLEGSPYAFSDRHYTLVRRLLTEGICRSIWCGMMDPSFCGRQVFIDAGRGKAYSLAVAAQNMAATGRPGSKTFARIATDNLCPGRRGGMPGSSYYYRSDCGIHRAHSGRWYASVRMHSQRTIGFEMTNSENLLAHFSADGALLTMQHGAEYENVFAAWDWRCIPGTTAYDDGRPLKSSDLPADECNRTLWVGGATDGRTLCTTMELRRDSLHGLKSYFFFDDRIVALGCGIRDEDPGVRRLFTTLEQNRLRGDVQVGTNEGTLRIDPAQPLERTFEGDAVRWVHHDGRGYLLLDVPAIELSTVLQRGKWDPIDPFYRDRLDSARIFKCRAVHPDPAEGRYAYAILPCRTAAQTARAAARGAVEAVRNDRGCQAVRCGKRLCAVFHRPDTLNVGRTALSSDAPALILLCGNELYVSSPTADRVAVALRRNGRTRRFEVALPTDPQQRGATVRCPIR